MFLFEVGKERRRVFQGTCYLKDFKFYGPRFLAHYNNVTTCLVFNWKLGQIFVSGIVLF